MTDLPLEYINGAPEFTGDKEQIVTANDVFVVREGEPLGDVLTRKAEEAFELDRSRGPLEKLA
jgi:hypothetical protein